MTHFSPARDRLRARPLHRRPERRQARRRHRAAQPLAPPAARRATCKEEVLPKNILMIGPTGVGKTEISRRLAKLAGAPFLKVEATKFTEVGYVGRDVDSIIRDLVEVGARAGQGGQAQGGARQGREERRGARARCPGRRRPPRPATRESFRKRLRAGELNDKEIEIQVAETGGGLPMFDIPGAPGASIGAINIGDMLGKAFGRRTKPRRVTVAGQLRRADRGGERQADRQRADRRRGDPRGREQRHRVPRRDRQDLLALRRRPHRRATSRARACSAICCR